MCIFSTSLEQKQQFSYSLRSDPQLSWAALYDSQASPTPLREYAKETGICHGHDQKGKPNSVTQNLPSQFHCHFSEWTVRQVILHHLDDSFQQRNISIFLVYHWKLLLKLSAVNMVSSCCTFCPLPCKKDFSDYFSSTNFPKRIPAGKLLDYITRHSRWQAESCNWELLQTLRRVKCYCTISFQKQSTSLPEIG